VFEELMTLLRGQANAAADKLAQSNALTILDQQIRDVGAIRFARRALAIAIAEATLAAVRTRQEAMIAAEEALDELTSTPARIEDRLGQAGFGPATRPTAATVLVRLRPLAIT
jgi:phage shock protein A